MDLSNIQIVISTTERQREVVQVAMMQIYTIDQTIGTNKNLFLLTNRHVITKLSRSQRE